MKNFELQHIQRRKRSNRIMHILFLFSTMIGIVTLGILLVQIIAKGSGWISLDFFTHFSSRFPEKSGIKAAFFGTLWLMLITAPLTFIIGVSTAIYLEEYAKNTWLSRFIQTNISNLAGVPSVVYGLLGLTIFVRLFDLGRSLISGALTMTLLVLPVIIVAARESLKAVPNHQRNASLALGANPWQTILRVVLPSAMPGILTGSILSLSRAIGETAPLIVVGAASYIAFVPNSLFSDFTAMPIQIYSWAGRPEESFGQLAAAGIIVLLIMLLGMNLIAIMLRNKYQRS